MQNLFEESSAQSCTWIANIEYTKMNGFVIKLMATLMPGMFKKQIQKWLDRFKSFAEREYNMSQ
ncbi:MAG: hypothetical protein HKN22_06420 [Bacteroidia bacterium]|nr:hypothetical protein [Bacteroidia bacterium]